MKKTKMKILLYILFFFFIGRSVAISSSQDKVHPVESTDIKIKKLLDEIKASPDIVGLRNDLAIAYNKASINYYKQKKLDIAIDL